MPENAQGDYAPPNSPFEGILHLRRDDDMYDSTTELDGNSLLARALRILAEICRPYWAANDLAIALQDEHRWITKWALRAATLTVLLAIAQLPLLAKPAGWVKVALAVLEGVSAIAALWLVGKGIWQSVQKKWLLERHKAERFRFVKYRWILELLTTTQHDPELAKWRKRAITEIETIEATDVPKMEGWMKTPLRVPKDDESMRSVVSHEDFEEIRNYFERKRLERQITYLEDRASTATERDALIKRLPSLLFLTSLVFATFHLLLEFTDFASKWLHEFIPRVAEVEWGTESALTLITLAALLPVFVAAIRTHRSAHEYSRNAVRFSAIRDELKDYQTTLKYPGSTRQLRALWHCEERLEYEHLEWLRLMAEAEWYG